MTTLSQIKNWFKAGLKPTQSQFWETWDSFFHKEEIIPQDNIQDLTNTLAAKAEKSQIDAHASNLDAHSLNTRLAAKADVVHTHEITQVNDLQDALDASVYDNTKIPLPTTLPASEEVVKLDENGNSSTIPTYEFFKVDYTNTEYPSINDLIQTGGYSTENGWLKGTQVVCPLTSPPVMYMKTGDNDTDWIAFNGIKLPLE